MCGPFCRHMVNSSPSSIAAAETQSHCSLANEFPSSQIQRALALGIDLAETQASFVTSTLDTVTGGAELDGVGTMASLSFTVICLGLWPTE
jgi:hypothetical protein